VFSRATSRIRGAAVVALAALLAFLIMSGSFAATADEASGAAIPAAGMYELDPPHTFIQFSAQHLVVGRVDGRFDKAKGNDHCRSRVGGIGRGCLD
jgi:polyisoprenoid-binding protein YceI